MTPPDFEKMAHDIAMSVPIVRGAAFILHRAHIANQLREVWNARGAADLAALDATVTYTKVASFEGSRRQTWGAIRELDR